MRLAVKATLVLLISYVLFVAAIGYWLERSVRALSKNLTKNTARLLANDVAAAITLPVLEQLQQADSAARERLEAIIDDVTQRSEVLASLTVVDEAGRVVAGDEAEPGRQLDAPAVVFPSGNAPELVSPRFRFQAGAYYLYVPLLDQGQVLGYLRLGLSSPPLVSIYYRSREEFFVLAGCGFIGVLLLGLALQLQLARRGVRLAEAVDEVLRNPLQSFDPGGDDLLAAVDVARRTGAKVAEVRRRADDAERQRDALAQGSDAGVLLLGQDKGLEFANAAARGLFGCAREGELEARWAELGARLATQWDDAPVDENGIALVDVEVGGGGPPRRLHCEISDFDSDGAGGFLVVARDAGLGRALDDQLGQGLRMRALSAFCGAMGDEARAATAAVATALNELRELLPEAGGANGGDAAAGRGEQRRRCLERIARQVESLDRQVENLLLHTRPAEARESIELGELVEDGLGLAEPAARARHVEIEPRIPGEAIVWTGARQEFTKALLSLVLYSIDAAPGRRRLVVELGCEGADAVLSVGDPTPGSVVENGEDLFVPVLVNPAGEARLGLRVAYAFAVACGGRLEVNARSDGCAFCRLTLPLAGRRRRVA